MLDPQFKGQVKNELISRDAVKLTRKPTPITSKIVTPTRPNGHSGNYGKAVLDRAARSLRPHEH